jgi:hypothetical protein
MSGVNWNERQQHILDNFSIHFENFKVALQNSIRHQVNTNESTIDAILGHQQEKEREMAAQIAVKTTELQVMEQKYNRLKQEFDELQQKFNDVDSKFVRLSYKHSYSFPNYDCLDLQGWLEGDLKEGEWLNREVYDEWMSNYENYVDTREVEALFAEGAKEWFAELLEEKARDQIVEKRTTGT